MAKKTLKIDPLKGHFKLNYLIDNIYTEDKPSSYTKLAADLSLKEEILAKYLLVILFLRKKLNKHIESLLNDSVFEYIKLNEYLDMLECEVITKELEVKKFKVVEEDTAASILAFLYDQRTILESHIDEVLINLNYIRRINT